MRLFFRKYGSGKPIIILHGLYGISDNWVGIGKRLSENFTVYLPDLRNHGQSPFSPTMNYPSMADDLGEFIETNELPAPVIIGHSMGGKVAMQFALDNPDIPSRLVVVDISPGTYPLETIHLDVLQAMMSVDFTSISSRSEVEHHISLWIPDRRLQLFIMKNLYRKTRTSFGWRLNLTAINDNLEALAEGVISHRPFTLPVLFIKGGRSGYIRPEDNPPIHEYFPNSEIKEIKDAGHWVHADTPIELSAILSQFLSKDCTMKD